MSLAERLEAARKTPTKSLDRIISELDKEDADALNAAATDPEVSTAAIVAALKDEGFRIGKQTVTDWRRSRGFTR